mmetsp:Transcript_11110/g.45297  ORF Transcript_11110/g.45297 Transcript_11110/m.45297 type:complete len:730 (+) Transcript_11110:214-2403(+)|eukprot:CAMPEP_0114619820 /NCGR_PEP_ID=MMETSP0168-20121206/8405_1 /TAXON_ID=95228 ORGANISM="Vannella sp., Strain DIVA3 517/6/12" /NCGR_SAMPLE_ID=MMETSP0168 /ASSEMBLY_ACC=CAM_ASM_000044 /LENGTH=729 /DNA_ID=CAMNT_0001830989 /DNA_START=139 /DNA_END=2328 /DNA_ORIENTATION=-
MVKVLVSIAGAGGKEVEHELVGPTDIAGHLQALCGQLNAPEEPTKYCFKEAGSNRIITNQDIAKQTVKEGCRLSISLSPTVEANMYIEKIRADTDPIKLKTNFFWVKKNLEEPQFAQAFLMNDGIKVIAGAIIDLTGNALAYGFQALEKAMSYGTGWGDLTDEQIQAIVNRIESWDEVGVVNKTNVVNCALRIAMLLADAPRHGYSTIHKAIVANGLAQEKEPYKGLIACIGSTSDLNMQIHALTLINNMLGSVPGEEEKEELLQTLWSRGLHKVLQRNIHIENQNFRKQIYKYQAARLQNYNKLREVAYDKTNPDHEAMLMQLWRAVFPDLELKSRVSEQWKAMGFQGTDPATDFRGMGLLGLSNLIYIAEKHPVIFRRIVKEQASRDDNDYPVAVTGISITQLLVTHFKVEKAGSGTEEEELHAILFDHDYAFEEIYCIVFQLLDRTWDEMNAAYMDFPKVISAVKEKVAAVAENNDSISSFRRGCSKGTVMEAIRQETKKEEEAKSQTIPLPQISVPPAVLQEITESTRKATIDITRAQKLQVIKAGAVFKELMKKGKHQAQTFLYLICSAEEDAFLWERVPDAATVPEYASIANRIPLEEIQLLLTGPGNPAFAKLKKAEEEVLKQGFSLQLRDGTCFDFVASSREVFVNWTDGIRVVTGAEMDTPETAEDVDLLVAAEVCCALINLEDLEIPEEAPDIPPPPDNYNFCMKDNKEMELQLVSSKG